MVKSGSGLPTPPLRLCVDYEVSGASDYSALFNIFENVGPDWQNAWSSLWVVAPSGRAEKCFEITEWDPLASPSTWTSTQISVMSFWDAGAVGGYTVHDVQLCQP